VLNWSGIFDEEEDFELNIRTVSGGAGLIVLEDGFTPDPNVGAFDPANANRRQLTVRGVPAWNAIKAYEQFGIRAPISPISKTDPDVLAGQNLFTQANCQSCHGGPQWTSGLLDFTPPPDPSLIVSGQLIDELEQVGTFDPNLLNEVRANAQAPLGADGFVPPSLLSLFAFQRAFFHNGAVDSLQAVLDNVTHRSAGSAGVDLLDDAELRRQLIQFLLSIDATTPPIPSSN
jgi:mono/diheme cytochrome c family protein